MMPDSPGTCAGVLREATPNRERPSSSSLLSPQPQTVPSPFSASTEKEFPARSTTLDSPGITVRLVCCSPVPVSSVSRPQLATVPLACRKNKVPRTAMICL